ncbi:unnamed protein product [Gulo gulo]|uniref:Uncharacterized protein n=1 Tax=Gulo gulo TaxID=48420 RepID=A0A9X9M721_GULGU|nr:unnamed protein product [Gulo gulo]
MSIKGKGKLDLRSGTVRTQDLFLSASTKESIMDHGILPCRWIWYVT